MHAVDTHARSLVRMLMWGLLSALVVGGCGKPQLWRANIQSEDPDERVLAIRAAAEAKDVQAVPLLVDRLEDEDAAVRFFSILALQKITGERFGYDYAQSAADRARAVSLWRAYLRGDRRTAAADAGGPDRPEPQASSPHEASR